MSEIGDDSIYFNKNVIDSEKYFKLFDKHIPIFYKSSNILIFSISNPVAIMHMIEKNPSARYIIVDEKETFSVIQILINNHDFECVYINIDDFDWYNINMKFDCIIMNPPYSRNLHLKILEQAIKQLKDHDSIVVNLSPVRWLQEIYMTNDAKKFKNSISDHLKFIDIISNETANNLFNIHLYANLGIYIAGKDIYNFNDKDFWQNFYNKEEISIVNKLKNHQQYISNVIEKNKKDGIRVLIASIAGNRGSLPVYKDLSYVIDGKNENGIDWTKCKNNGGYEKQEGMPIPISIKFANINYATNFYNTCKSLFIKYLSKRYLLDQHIKLNFLPWMGNVINPRTGLKGYESEWTNEDFYKYFNITIKEQYVIENFIK